MSDRLQRIAAIVNADVRIRFRRVSTLIIFLLLSGLAYIWVPAPSTGNTLLVLAGKRALYNSAAIGVGTASLATIFIGLAGFYVVSNAIRRDVTSRCGFVIASTTMRGTEYLFGKFFGNVIFLATFMAGFMVTSMAMLVVRGEARLEPLVFIWQYALLVPPVIVSVSAMAILFESIPFLSGKFGDVAYFFIWAAGLGFVASTIERGGDPGIAAYFDFSGFGFLLDTMTRTLHTTQVSIGHTTFDPAKGVFIFNGLEVSRAWIGPRIFSVFAPAVLVFVARPFFHRFDPARLKRTSEKSHRNWLTRINRMFKPLVRPFARLATAGGDSLFAAARTDAMMTIASNPLIVIAAIALMFVPMMVAIAVAAVMIADISSREKRAGTLGLTFTAPRLKARFVIWKLMSVAIVASLLVLVPAIRLIATRPHMAPQVIVGILFVVAFATALGIVSANPKTFIVLFLTFWYVVVNDSGHVAALDFAGWKGIATPAVFASYAALTIFAIAAAEGFHRADLRRNW